MEEREVEEMQMEIEKEREVDERKHTGLKRYTKTDKVQNVRHMELNKSIIKD